jgi:hypothetical protein
MKMLISASIEPPKVGYLTKSPSRARTIPRPKAMMNRISVRIWSPAWNQTRPGKLNNRIEMAPTGNKIAKQRAAMIPWAINFILYEVSLACAAFAAGLCPFTQSSRLLFLKGPGNPEGRLPPNHGNPDGGPEDVPEAPPVVQDVPLPLLVVEVLDVNGFVSSPPLAEARSKEKNPYF